MTIKGNKGEWSEFYAFLKILTDGKMFSADKDLKILKDSFYIVLKIIREETKGAKHYDISKNDGKVIISDQNSKLIDVVELSKIKSGVSDIFEAMKKSSSTTFQISSVGGIMKKLYCSQIKASSGKKVDLIVSLYDKKTSIIPELGFSIKSMLGSPSTLLNASGATNFIYKIIPGKKDNCDNDYANNMNGASKMRDRSKYIYETGGELKFCGTDSDIFRKNLRKIDSNFPEIIAEIIKLYYKSKGSKISELVDNLAEDKQFCEKMEMTKDDYMIIMKRFLSEIALGMKPKKEWDGRIKAHGGYIIVKEDGAVICYHLYDRDKFNEYLYNNTKLDTPSTTRHKFGDIYEENGEKMIKYNLQIRFIK